MDGSLIKLHQITKSFGAVRALRGVNFDLGPGEVHALLGENGAGKSTLIKVVTGAHRPDSGTINVAGRTVDYLTPASARYLGISVIYQQPALLADLSVSENIALSLEKHSWLRRVRWNAHRTQAAELLQRVGAAIDPETEVSKLSMPEQQLVEIARALGAGARVLILDEPTASLTSREVQLLMSVVRDLRSQGVGLIYISHRLDEIFQIADRVTVLRDGESVGTRAVSDVDQAGLIELMVGREVSTIYPLAENQPGQIVLSLRNVGCRSSDIHEVTLDVRAGEVVGLAGLIGAGRTELARTLFGITPLDHGEVLLNGQQLHVRTPREAVEAGIAYVPEDRRRHGVILDMPVAANMTMAIHSRLFPRSWLKIEAERALAVDYIHDLQIRTPSTETLAGHLSGGNQQKVALARWMAAKPKVLILDEPTQGVDVGAKAEIHKLIRGLAAQGVAILMISSDLPEILGMSNRIAIMRSGTVTQIFSREATDANQVMAVALGRSGGGR